MHILLTIVTVALVLLAIWFASASFGTRFHAYSLATILVMIVFGALAGFDGPKIATGDPTPWLGATERINIGAYLLWMAVLAIALLRRREKMPNLRQ